MNPKTTRKMFSQKPGLREQIVKEFLSASQKRLNLKRPPDKGLQFDNNKVMYEGPDAVILDNSRGKIAVSPFHNGVFHIHLQGKPCREPLPNSWTVDLTKRNPAGWTYKRNKDTIEYSIKLPDGAVARVLLEIVDCSIYCYIGSDAAIIKLFSPQVNNNWFIIESSVICHDNVKVFGLGENTPPMDKAGQKIVMWNTSPIIYEIGSTPLYQSWPVVLFQQIEGPALGLVFDNPGYCEFNFSSDGKKMKYAVKDTELSFFLLLGPTMPELLRQLSLLTGKLPPLPKWVLGYQQSRWSYAPSARVREIAAEFRKRDLPCDVIYLDIDYMDRYKCFTWGAGFEDHRELIEELHASGFKVITILDPALKIERGFEPYEKGISQGMFVVYPNGAPVIKVVWAGPSHFPDFINQKVRQWWGEMVGEFAARSGVDGIWCDMNEPSTFDLRYTLPPQVVHSLPGIASLPHELVHNLYGYLMSKATYEGLLKTRRLPYVITRSTFLGGQKYATSWTGDIDSSWEQFRASIPMILNLGLSGQPLVGPDIGGYTGGPSPELYQRWILQGALYPYSRTHCRKNSGNQEPWSFGPAVEDSARRAIKLRYKLIPYLYSLLYKASVSGQPVMRPIFYHHPAADALKTEFYETEFLLGPSLLAAPLMDPVPTRSCYLPPGRWYSWWRKKELKGGQIYETTIEEDTDMPLFISDNSVIPLYPENISFIPNHSLDSLEIMVAVGDKAEGAIVEYFDRDGLLAFRVKFFRAGIYIEGTISLWRRGIIPEEYHAPVTLYISINHRVKKADFSPGCTVKFITPDPVNDLWTRICVSPVFPLKMILSLNS
jgi:alpha-glucosidase